MVKEMRMGHGSFAFLFDKESIMNLWNLSLIQKVIFDDDAEMMIILCLPKLAALENFTPRGFRLASKWHDDPYRRM